MSLRGRAAFLPPSIAIGKVARRVGWITLVISLGYLLAANLLLQTRLLRDLVSEGPDLELEYQSAYSLWPGRARFRGLSLIAQDYNVQFAVHVDSGEVDVSLHELLLSRFHALAVKTEGTSFRFRHKVQDASGIEERLAAYPPMPGYPDLPLYSGPEPPALSDAEYNLWEIVLENVAAELAELWFLEHRYIGAGTARGGFWLKPARWFEVFPATLELRRGALAFGSRTTVERLDADIGCRVERTIVTEESGLGVLRSVFARVAIDARDLDLSTAKAYLPPELRLEGWADLEADVGLTAGVLDAGSRVHFSACPLRLHTSSDQIVGGVTSDWRVSEAGRVEAQISAPELELGPVSAHRPAVAIAPRLTLLFSMRDVTQSFVLEKLEVALPDLEVPSLGALDGWLSRAGVPIELDGRADGELHLGWQPPSALEGRAKLRVIGGEITTRKGHASLAGLASVSLSPSAGEAGAAALGSALIELDDVRLGRGDEEGPPFRATLRTNSLRLVLQPEPRLSATWQLSAEPAKAVLPVVIGAPVLERLAAKLLDLDRLDAKTKLVASRRLTRIELARGESGALGGRGFWQRAGRGKGSGAFLLTTNVANVGLSLQGSDVETDLFVPDDWLEKREQRVVTPAASAKPRR